MVLLKSINVPLRTKAIDFCLNGQIDDNWQEPDEVTSHDLSDAIESLLEGKTHLPINIHQWDVRLSGRSG